MAIGIGIGLSPSFGGGGGSAPVAAIDSAAIVGVTALDPKTYLAVPYGIDLNGLAAEITCDDTGTSPAPDATKFTLVIENPGFKNGVATNRRTQFKGRVLCPKQAISATFVHDPLYDTSTPGKRKFWVVFGYDPDGTNALEAGGADVCRMVDVVHVDATVVSLEAAAGWYGAAAAGFVSGVANNSSVFYPPIEAHSIEFENEYSASATRTVRFQVSHPYGQHGRMFDRARVRGTDGAAASTAWTNVDDVVLGAVSPGGLYATICSASYNATALADGMIRDEIQVYPLIGTSAEVFDSTAFSAADDMRTTTSWRKDVGGSFGITYVVIENGAGTGVVSSTLATAEASPYGSLSAGWNAAIATGKHVIMYLRNTTGSDITLDKAGTFNANSTGVAAVIRPHPSNTAKLKFGMGSASHSFPKDVIFDGVDVVRTSTSGSFTATAASAFMFRNGTVNLDFSAGSAPWCGNWARSYFENYTIATNSTPGVVTAGLGANGANAYHCKVANGVYNTTLVQFTIVPYTFLALRGKFTDIGNDRGSGQPSNEGGILHAARLEKITSSLVQWVGKTYDYNSGRGFHFEQLEIDFKTNSRDISFGADGTLNALDNINISYMTNAPNPSDVTDSVGRANIGYNDAAGSQGIVKHVRLRFSNAARWAVKTSWFDYTASGAGRVANFRTWLMAGWLGNVISLWRDPENLSSTNSEWGGAYRTPWSSYPTSSSNSFIPAYANNNVADGTDTPGDYQPVGLTNRTYDRVPAGHQLIKFDIKGRTRRTDGTGAAAAQEGSFAA